ncbi:MAG TPA: nuclear transport factor 2 family protein [Pyrinomonadaceae bacterium]|nr:nuclear transport factor 2 family protein [Pyrinomonadaceae bacterium]
MKKTFWTILVVFMAVASLSAQTAPDGQELTRLLNEFLAGAGRNDAAVHDRFWAEDLIYTRGVGVRTNKEELMKGVRSAPARKADDPVTVYTAEDLRIQQYGDAAVVAFKLVGTTTRPDGTKTVSNHLNTGTFIKRGGKWQAVAWQATPIPGPKATSQTAEPTPSLLDAKPTLPPANPNILQTSLPPSPSRTYIKGPRGGCYYLNSGGKKIYVDHSNCK